MKIYVIHVDACPVKKELLNFAKIKNLHVLKQFTGGIFTIPTLFSMYHGKNSSKIIPNGMSYFGSEHDVPNYFKFRDNYNDLITILNKSNFEVILDNMYQHFRLVNGFRVDELNKKLDLMKIKLDNKNGIYYRHLKDHKTLFNTKLFTTEYSPCYLWCCQKFDDDDITDKFYNKLKHHINYLQSKKNDIFYSLILHDYHDLVGIFKKKNITDPGIQKIYVDKSMKRITDYLSTINFDEPDSIFWIYSDHGIGSNEKYDLENYYTWCFFKDNTTKNKIPRNLISCCDFYKTVLDKINISDKLDYRTHDHDSLNIYESLNKDRIYYLEDSRMYTSPIASNTHAAVKIIKWNENVPLEILQLTYIRGICDTENKIFIYLYTLKTDSNYLFHENYTKKELCHGDAHDILSHIKDHYHHIEDLYYNIYMNNPCLLNKKLSSIISDELIEMKTISKNNILKSPEKYKIFMDNVDVYRYKERDDAHVFDKVLPNLKKYNNLMVNILFKKRQLKMNNNTLDYYLHPLAKENILPVNLYDDNIISHICLAKHEYIMTIYVSKDELEIHQKDR